MRGPETTWWTTSQHSQIHDTCLHFTSLHNLGVINITISRRYQCMYYLYTWSKNKISSCLINSILEHFKFRARFLPQDVSYWANRKFICSSLDFLHKYRSPVDENVWYGSSSDTSLSNHVGVRLASGFDPKNLILESYQLLRRKNEILVGRLCWDLRFTALPLSMLIAGKPLLIQCWNGLNCSTFLIAWTVCLSRSLLSIVFWTYVRHLSKRQSWRYEVVFVGKYESVFHFA